jgi:hypothetical protein
MPLFLSVILLMFSRLQQICEALGYAESSLATFSKVHEVYERVFRSESKKIC